MNHDNTAVAMDMITRTAFPEESVRRLNQLHKLPEGRLPSICSLQEGSLDDKGNIPYATTSPAQVRRVNMSFRSSTKPEPRVTQFVLEQQFDGVVISIDPLARSFIARLVDRTSNWAEEEAEIELDEISPDDHPLIVPGALFTWDIGREQDKSKQVRRVSSIRFRRFFRFCQSDIERAHENAERMLELLNDENSSA